MRDNIRTNSSARLAASICMLMMLVILIFVYLPKIFITQFNLGISKKDFEVMTAQAKTSLAENDLSLKNAYLKALIECGSEITPKQDKIFREVIRLKH